MGSVIFTQSGLPDLNRITFQHLEAKNGRQGTERQNKYRSGSQRISFSKDNSTHRMKDKRLFTDTDKLTRMLAALCFPDDCKSRRNSLLVAEGREMR